MATYTETQISRQQPHLPSFGADCVSTLIPQLLSPSGPPPWLADGRRVPVVLVLDGLGWGQFDARRALMPVLGEFAGGPIVTVAPSTTATALTSITTGLTPGEHGIVGYRMMLGGNVVNSLRWSSTKGDMRAAHPPAEVQPFAPFLGDDVAVVTRRGFEGSGFSVAHLRGTRTYAWSEPSNLAAQCAAAVRSGAALVYAYYDGIDHVAHEFGFGEFYDDELRLADHLVDRLLEALPAGTPVVVTADHGQVDVPGPLITLDADVAAMVRTMSGEARFRWLHAKPGTADELYAAALERYGDVAWVVTSGEVLAGGWLGPAVSTPVASRLGDVALIPFAPVGFDDPAERIAIELRCRHGSLTIDEMFVPRLAKLAGH